MFILLVAKFGPYSEPVHVTLIINNFRQFRHIQQIRMASMVLGIIRQPGLFHQANLHPVVEVSYYLYNKGPSRGPRAPETP